ncbi:MAG: protein-methionine-sulfoxide reductase heme-binding subunit MsrQ [Rhodobacterales bacterium]|nr:MAG: protein-methionine-sulfoxide reductase heme-binding subunit MsrQ [Rhodobacterales bacterium]
MIGRINDALRRVPVWAVYLVGILPPFWMLYQGVTGNLGVDPTKAMEHQLGKLGLQALILGLAVTPLRGLIGLNLMKFRRAIGVLSFYYITTHLLVWLLLDVQIAAQIWADIVKRPYITIGMAGFVLLVPLAATSNNYSVRKLGPAWRKLHKLTYPAVVLGGVHFVMLTKSWQVEPIAYFTVIVLLLSYRAFKSATRKRIVRV